MDTERERYRFDRLNEIIAESFAPLATLLEVGCGEGHQTRYLQKVSREVYGFDISRQAINRARKSVPGAHFMVSDLLSYPGLPGDARFDLVVASEVLYYIHDSELPDAIARLNMLGANCLVSYYEREIERLDPLFEGIPGCRSADISFAGSKWRVRWWKNP